MKKAFLLLALLAVLFLVMASMNNGQIASGANTQTLSDALTGQQPTPGGYSVVGPPTIQTAQINRILAAYHSPAAGLGQYLYDEGLHYGIDPVHLLAIWLHESRFGTSGEARKTMSPGNERCITDRPCVDPQLGGYAQMESWQDGITHLYMLLAAYASGEIERELTGTARPLTTPDTIIPVFAPSSDGNNEAAYIAAWKHAVDTWRAGGIWV